MNKQKGKWKDRLKFLVPILVLLIGIAFVVTFEFYIKDKVNSVEVVVAKDNIDFKERISEDDLTIANVHKDSQASNTYRPDEIEYIIGEFASIKISEGTQLYPDLIDSYDLVPDETKGEFIAPLPDEWLFAVAGSLRRAYLADFYIVPSDEQAQLEELIKDSQSHDDETNNSTENENGDTENNEESSGEQDELLETDEETEQIIKERYQPILEDVRISSVKDGSNQEVTESEEDPNATTGSISTLEIIATNEILQTIQEKTQEGYKLYIVHKFTRSADDNNDTESEDETNGESEETE